MLAKDFLQIIISDCVVFFAYDPQNGLHALRAIANGKDSVEKAMFRPDLQKYGSDGNILIEWGKAGNPEKDFKKVFGISHIAARHGDDTVINVVNALATGDIDRYVDGNKTIVISNGKYEATLALTKYGDNKTWLLSGWDKIENTDGSGKVSASTTPTQGNPTFSRESLGAVISDANLRKLFLLANGNENNLNKNKNSANQTSQNEGGIRESIDVNPEQTKTDNFKKWFGDWEKVPENASKVVDEDGKPLVVYHHTNATEIVNRKTGQKYDDLDWEQRDYWDNEATDEEWNKTWKEQDFNVFDSNKARRSVEVPGFFCCKWFESRGNCNYKQLHTYLRLLDKRVGLLINFNVPLLRDGLHRVVNNF